MTQANLQNAWVQFPVLILLDTSVSHAARLAWAYLRHRQGGNVEAWTSLKPLSELEQAGLVRTGTLRICQTKKTQCSMR